MITIPISTLIVIGFGLFVAAVFLIGMIAYWKACLFRAEAERVRAEAEREKKAAIEERTKAELILEEAKRHGYRPERRPVSGKWGRLGFSKGPVGPESCPGSRVGPTGVTAWSGLNGYSGPTGPCTKAYGPFENGRDLKLHEILQKWFGEREGNELYKLVMKCRASRSPEFAFIHEMLYRRPHGLGYIDEKLIALFKEIMTGADYKHF